MHIKNITNSLTAKYCFKDRILGYEGVGNNCPNPFTEIALWRKQVDVKLSYIVPKIITGGYTQGELVEFINVVQRISLSYLKYQEIIGKHIRWERRGKPGELEDMASDCIAGLFARNEVNEFVQLRRYFGPVLGKTDDLNDVELLVMLRRLVIKKTKQELSRIFKERDPEGAKIIRNIRVAIRDHNDCGMLREAGKEYALSRPANFGKPTALSRRRTDHF